MRILAHPPSYPLLYFKKNCYLCSEMENLSGIRNIVFDLGGVLIDLDRDRAVRELEALGLLTAGKLLDLYRQAGPFLELETGRITAGAFYDMLRSECDAGTTDVQIQEAFNSFLEDLPIQRLHTLRRLKAAGFRVLALSNTNPVMYNSRIAEFFRQEGLSINDYFDGIVTSFQEGCCKPDPKIFHILINRYSLIPSQTLYLDDGEANCRAAEKAGLHTLHVTPERPMTLLNDLI